MNKFDFSDYDFSVMSKICTTSGEEYWVISHPNDSEKLIVFTSDNISDYYPSFYDRGYYIDKIALCPWGARGDYLPSFDNWELFNEEITELIYIGENQWEVVYGTRITRVIHSDLFPDGALPLVPMGYTIVRPTTNHKPTEPQICVDTDQMSEPKKYDSGTIIRIDGCGDYMLACVDVRLYSLIDLKCGNRWTEPMRVESGNTRTVTDDDINEMVGDDYTWQVVECDGVIVNPSSNHTHCGGLTEMIFD